MGRQSADALVDWIMASNITLEIYHVGRRSRSQMLLPEHRDVEYARAHISLKSFMGNGTFYVPYQFNKRSMPATLYACFVYLWAWLRPQSDHQEAVARVGGGGERDQIYVLLTRTGIRAMNGAETRLLPR